MNEKIAKQALKELFGTSDIDRGPISGWSFTLYTKKGIEIKKVRGHVKESANKSSNVVRG